MVITADGGYRRGAVVPLKKNVDDALGIKAAPARRSPSIDKVVVVRRCAMKCRMAEGRDRLVA